MSRRRKIRKLAFEIAAQFGFEITENSKDVLQGTIAYIDPKSPYLIQFVDEIKNNLHLIVLLHEMGHTLARHYEIYRPTPEDIHKLIEKEDREGLKHVASQAIDCEKEAWLYGFRLFHDLCPDIVLSEEEIFGSINSLATWIDYVTGGVLKDEEITEMTKICFREVFEQLKREYPNVYISEKMFDFELQRKQEKRGLKNLRIKDNP